MTMNLLKKFTSVLALALVLFGPSTAIYAQQNTIDQDRMNRDLSITDDILGKIFSENYNQSLPFGNQGVDASYLPGYGIIYHISGSSFMIFRHLGMGRMSGTVSTGSSKSNGKGNSTGSAVVVGGRGKGRYWFNNAENRLTRQQVIDRATEFLGNYGSTIGQLKPTDRITVIYDEGGSNFMPNIYLAIQNSDSTETKPLNLAISAKKADIIALNQNRISKKEFSNRLSVDDIEDGQKHKDLDIFSEILTQALKNTQNFEYSVRGQVNFAYMKDFGVIYYVNAEYSLQYLSILSEDKSVTIRSAQDIQISDKNSDKKMQEAYNRFVDAMKDYITNYGRTLHTLKSGQELVVSANLNNGVGGEGKRVTFTIKADILEELNSGKITPKQAANDIQIRSF